MAELGLRRSQGRAGMDEGEVRRANGSPGKVRGILWWVLSVGSDVANTPGCVRMSSYPHQISGCRSA